MSTAVPVALLDHDPVLTLPVEHVCDISVALEAPLHIPTPVGTRLTYITNHGVVSGPRIRGELLGGGGDWIVLGADGISRLDVRGTIRTDDGVLIHYESRGLAKLPAGGRETIAAGGRVPFESGYIRTTPRFETSDERYAWLAERVFVGVNEFSAGHIDYRIYSVS
jgi:Protein of unknown function (DUF3237)